MNVGANKFSVQKFIVAGVDDVVMEALEVVMGVHEHEVV